MTDNILELENVSKSYGKNCVLKDMTLSVEKGEILAIIGPSGAGKSTLLRITDGLEAPSSGTVRLFGEELSKKTVRSLRDKCGMLFQKTVLFDRSVEENIALGLSYRHLPRDERKARVKEALDKLDMGEFARRNAKKLSGGEGQRVAFARVLVTRPELIFLDEPTANLDPIATKNLEDMILAENRVNKTTIIINTHDQAQAQRLACRVAVLIDGEIRQIGEPDEIWDKPADKRTAEFVGFQNIVPAHLIPGCGTEGFAAIRAEDIRISAAATDVSARIVSLARSGAFLEIKADTGEACLSINIPWKEAESVTDLSVGRRIFLAWNEMALVHLKR